MALLLFAFGWTALCLAFRSGPDSPEETPSTPKSLIPAPLPAQESPHKVGSQQRLLHQLRLQIGSLQQWQQQRSKGLVAGDGEPMLERQQQEELELLARLQGHLDDLQKDQRPASSFLMTTQEALDPTTTTRTTAPPSPPPPPPTSAPAPPPAPPLECPRCACRSQPKPSPNPATAQRWAFVMMAHDEPGKFDHLMGVLAMARALQRLSNYPLVLLTNATVFPDGTPVAEGLERLNVQILPVYPLDLPERADLMLNHWKVAFWKLQIWNLVQFEKLVWLDSDAILYRSVDWLFDRSWMWAQRDDWFCKQGVEKVCSGIMLLFPGRRDFQGLLEYARTLEDMRDGDQQLISMYFEKVRHKPIHLLSDLEAAFGQCLGSAPTPYINPDQSAVWGVWDTPTFIHKSGGWRNTNENSYNNVCFSHNMRHQHYTINGRTLNVCHYHPLGSYWRDLFCEASRIVGVASSLHDIQAFCSDACWYGGKDPNGGAAECGPLAATIDYSDYHARTPGTSN